MPGKEPLPLKSYPDESATDLQMLKYASELSTLEKARWLRTALEEAKASDDYLGRVYDAVGGGSNFPAYSIGVVESSSLLTKLLAQAGEELLDQDSIVEEIPDSGY